MKKILIKYINLILFLTLLFSLSLIGCSQKEIAQKSVKNDKYTILTKENILNNDIKTYIYTVIINEKLSKVNIEKLCDEIIEKAKDENAFNAIQIHLYDGEYSALGKVSPTLGKYTFSPNGDISKAMDIETGEYEKMKILSEVKNVNWNLRPSEESIKIISMYNEIFDKASKSSSDGVIKKEDIIKETAELMNITLDEVNKALEELDNWVYQE